MNIGENLEKHKHIYFFHIKKSQFKFMFKYKCLIYLHNFSCRDKKSSIKNVFCFRKKKNLKNFVSQFGQNMRNIL